MIALAPHTRIVVEMLKEAERQEEKGRGDAVDDARSRGDFIACARAIFLKSWRTPEGFRRAWIKIGALAIRTVASWDRGGAASREKTEPLFYVVSLKHTDTNGPFVSFHRAKSEGYTLFISAAGRFTKAEVDAQAAAEPAGWQQTIALPCDDIEGHALHVVHVEAVDAIRDARAAWFRREHAAGDDDAPDSAGRAGAEVRP